VQQRQIHRAQSCGQIGELPPEQKKYFRHKKTRQCQAQPRFVGYKDGIVYY
jgi:hypothetical protein